MPIPLGYLSDDEGKRLPFGVANQSTFILPFHYRLRRREESNVPVEAAFVPEVTRTDADTIQRKQYLTGETRALLFGDESLDVKREVEWFRLEAGNESTLRWYFQRDEDAPARFVDLPFDVRLVLFDARMAREARTEDTDCGQIGFLLVRIEAVCGMSLADLLDVNCHLRLRYFEYEKQMTALRARPGRPPCNGAARYSCYDVRLGGFEPGRGARSANGSGAGEGDWRIGFWSDLLRCPVRKWQPGSAGASRRLFDLEADLDVYPDSRTYLASQACLARVEWDVRSGSFLHRVWHQVLYVEATECPDALTEYETRWVNDRTYERWVHSGRFFGFSNFSFCALCNQSAYAVPARHFELMYLDQLLLVLYQRVAIFSFGRRLSALSQSWKEAGWGGVLERFREFRAAFGQFVNLYWFPVFSNQVQSLEMYELAREQLDNKELFEELREEMDGTWDFMNTEYERTSTEWEAKVSRGGLVFAVFGLALGFFGLSLIDVGDSGWAEFRWPVCTAWLAFASFGSAVGAAFQLCVKQKKERPEAWTPFVFLAVLFAVAAVLCAG